MAEGPVQNPDLLLPRWHGLFTRLDLQDALRDLAEEREALGADECIALTLNPQEFLLPIEVPINDMENTHKHMYFAVVTWEQYLAMEDLAGARVNHKWWGYREAKQTQERSGADLKTKRHIQDNQKIHVNTWNITGSLCRRRRYMVDPVDYQRITGEPLPMPRIVILQWMRCPKMNRLLRAAMLNNEPEPERPRGMDYRGPLPPLLPPVQPQDEGEPQGEGNPGGNNGQQQQQQLELLTGTAALTFDGLMGTEDMSFVKCKLESLVINHHKLEEQLAAISTRYASFHELIEKAPHVIDEICSFKDNLNFLAMKHNLIKEQVDTISTGLSSIEELMEKAPQVVSQVFSLNGAVECVSLKQKKLEEKMDTIWSWFLSSEELVEKAPQVVSEVFSLKGEVECVSLKQKKLEEKIDTIWSWFEDKLDFLLEKTDALEEQMDSLSSSCLSWKENYKVLSEENDNVKEEVLALKENCKVLSEENDNLMEEVISLKENYMVLSEENENLKEVVLSLKKVLPPSMGNANLIGVSVKKAVSIIGMRKAKGKNKEEGLALCKLNTSIKKDILGLKKMVSLLWKANVVFSTVVPGNVFEREVVHGEGGVRTTVGAP